MTFSVITLSLKWPWCQTSFGRHNPASHLVSPWAKLRASSWHCSPHPGQPPQCYGFLVLISGSNLFDFFSSTWKRRQRNIGINDPFRTLCWLVSLWRNPETKWLCAFWSQNTFRSVLQAEWNRLPQLPGWIPGKETLSGDRVFIETVKLKWGH